MIRQTTFILLLSIGLLAAKCQEPDFHGYTQEYMDSTITHYDNLLLLNTQNCNEELMNSLLTIDSLENRIEILEFATNPRYIDVYADTFRLELVDDRLKIEVDKEDYNIWITLTDGRKRTHLDLHNFKRTIILADSLQTVGMWRPD